MRVSTIPDTDGYHAMVAKEDLFKVYLDGKDVSKKYFIFTVDEDEYFIDIYLTDAKGTIIIVDDDGNPATDRLFGDVKLKFKWGL